MGIPSKETILLVVSDRQISFLLEKILAAANFQVINAVEPAAVRSAIVRDKPALIIVAEKVGELDGLTLLGDFIKDIPAAPVLLLVSKDTPELLKRALQAGVNDYLTLPLRTEDLLGAVQNSLSRAHKRKEWVLLESKRASASLQRRVDEMETLARLGRTITSSLDLDSVLTAVVEAAVTCLGAEEGSLMLVDEETGELYMRATRNVDDAFARAFRMPVQNTLLGSVLSTGKAVLIDEKTPQKIKTAFLVHSLIYVPLQVKGHVFGILGVDNRLERLSFTDRDVRLLEAIAEYAVVALENARRYTTTSEEQEKLETVLQGIQDGVIVTDQDRRILLVNPVAREAFGLERDAALSGRQFHEIFPQAEMQALIQTNTGSLTNRAEINVEDGRVFSVLATSISGLGKALALHDITYLKKMDKIKSDFVSTVSHDLRSPLTAIMGYVELIDRVGPVNERQREFIRRVHVNVINITSLIDDLLNLGHIESGFDSTKESVHLGQLVEFAIEGFRRQIDMKDMELKVELPASLPSILANPVQIRQMVDKMLDNAIKYTPPGGSVTLRGEQEGDQVILQVCDNGIGVPAVDLPYIFDKFYRASNLSGNIPGAGLGLAIVKSIVEAHQGRIWVDSTPGRGTTFTVVLPISPVTELPADRLLDSPDAG